jgi:hypothetical protein
MYNIGFIGNCQMIELCYYLQELFKNNKDIRWCLYGDKFKSALHRRIVTDNNGRKIELNHWADKCKNKIIDYNQSIRYIKSCDVIIYQKIKPETSKYFNEENILKMRKPDSKLIKLPSIHIDYNNYNASILELQKREKENNVDIFVSEILNKYRPKKLTFDISHPNPFLFKEILKEICFIINIKKLSDKK